MTSSDRSDDLGRQLTEKAERLVLAAHALAASASTSVERALPSLPTIDPSTWDFFVTVGGVFVAMEALGQCALAPSQVAQLSQSVIHELLEWDPDAPGALHDCKDLFDQTYPRLAPLADYAADPDLATADAVGHWIAWNLLQKAPSSPHDLHLARTVGLFAVKAFADWWAPRLIPNDLQPSPAMPRFIALQQLHCLNPACGAPLTMTCSAALAWIAFHGRHDASFELACACETCHHESRCSYEAVLRQLPVEERPRLLNHDELQVVFLVEMEASEELHGRAFLGERVLATRVADAPNGASLATVHRAPVVAPYLFEGDVVRYSNWGEIPVVTHLRRHSKDIVIEPRLGATSNAIGWYLMSDDAPGVLRSGNLPCANPTCSCVFSITFTEFADSMRHASSRSAAIGAEAAMMLMTCNACGTSRVISTESFEGLAKA